MKNIFFGVISVIIIIFAWASINMGVFKPVHIKETKYPEMFLVYKEHVGPYHKILPTLESVEKWAVENKLDCSKSFGQYFDNPDVKEHARLKSHVGCWLPSKTELPLPEGFHSKTIPSQEYVVGEFLGSPAIGPFKVYGEAKEYFVAHKWPLAEDVIEIYERYDKDSLKTYYLFRKTSPAPAN